MADDLNPDTLTEDEIDEMINARLIETGMVHLVGTPKVKAVRERIKRMSMDELVAAGIVAIERHG